MRRTRTVNAFVGSSGPTGDDTSEDEMRHQVSGYTRLYKLGMRQGDGAEMAIIELVQE